MNILSISIIIRYHPNFLNLKEFWKAYFQLLLEANLSILINFENLDHAYEKKLQLLPQDTLHHHYKVLIFKFQIQDSHQEEELEFPSFSNHTFPFMKNIFDLSSMNQANLFIKTFSFIPIVLFLFSFYKVPLELIQLHSQKNLFELQSLQYQEQKYILSSMDLHFAYSLLKIIFLFEALYENYKVQEIFFDLNFLLQLKTLKRPSLVTQAMLQV